MDERHRDNEWRYQLLEAVADWLPAVLVVLTILLLLNGLEIRIHFESKSAAPTNQGEH